MTIHPREHDVILATHARGIYMIDDITPLRAPTAQALESDVAFLASRPSPMVMPVSEFGFNGDAEFVGANPSEGAVITYYLKKRHLPGDLKLDIYDPQGTLLGTVPGGRRRGINRVEWTMRSKAPRWAPGAGLIPSLGSLMGPRVSPGTDTVKMIKRPRPGESRVGRASRKGPAPRASRVARGRVRGAADGPRVAATSAGRAAGSRSCHCGVCGTAIIAPPTAARRCSCRCARSDRHGRPSW